MAAQHKALEPDPRPMEEQRDEERTPGGLALTREEQRLLQAGAALGGEVTVRTAMGEVFWTSAGRAELAAREATHAVGGGVLRREVKLADGATLAVVVRSMEDRGETTDRREGLRAAHHVLALTEHVLRTADARAQEAQRQRALVEELRCDLFLTSQRLAQAIQRVREADRVKVNFLATVSHELRTPLTSVLGYTEMILDGLAGPLSDDQREYLGTVMSKGEQLLGLIGKLLDVSRIEAIGVQLDLREVVVRALLEDVREPLAALARRKHQALQLLIPEGLRTIHGDAGKLYQLFSNLLGNAIKFTKEQGRVTVEAENYGEGVEVRVRDTGIGIPAAARDKIFDAFYQIDNSTTRAHEGPGLGLALVRHFVEAHGGKVWVEANEPQGSVFVVRLPSVPPPPTKRIR